MVQACDMMLVHWSQGGYGCIPNFLGSDYLKDKKGYEGKL